MSNRPSVINQFPLPIRDLYLDISGGLIATQMYLIQDGILQKREHFAS